MSFTNYNSRTMVVLAGHALYIHSTICSSEDTVHMGAPQLNSLSRCVLIHPIYTAPLTPTDAICKIGHYTKASPSITVGPA